MNKLAIIPALAVIGLAHSAQALTYVNIANCAGLPTAVDTEAASFSSCLRLGTNCPVPAAAVIAHATAAQPAGVPQIEANNEGQYFSLQAAAGGTFYYRLIGARADAHSELRDKLYRAPGGALCRLP